MPRYIDSDALKSYLNEREYADMYYIEALFGIIDRQPTVSPDEVRGVVHCKECKWCHAGYCEKHDDIIPWGCANKPWKDWFCADGKRREAKKEAQDAD